MPQDNLEVVRAFYETVNRWLDAHWADPEQAVEEIPEFEEVMDRMTPDAEWDWLFSPDVFRGRPGLVRAVADYLETVSEWQIEVGGLDEGPQGLVVANLEVVVRGKGSGTPVRQPVSCLVTVSDGKVARLKDYTNRADALEAAGAAT